MLGLGWRVTRVAPSVFSRLFHLLALSINLKSQASTLLPLHETKEEVTGLRIEWDMFDLEGEIGACGADSCEFESQICIKKTVRPW